MVTFSGQAEKVTRAGRVATSGSSCVPERGTSEQNRVNNEVIGTQVSWRGTREHKWVDEGFDIIPITPTPRNP